MSKLKQQRIEELEEINKEMLEALIIQFSGIGKWLSAALSDEKVCKEMKKDIKEWFKVFEIIEKATGKSIEEIMNDNPRPI
jgi:hypothetical protein